MKKRQHMSRHASKKVFKKTAKGHHPKNQTRNPMRGGIRL